jgi:hypothetical protein
MDSGDGAAERCQEAERVERRQQQKDGGYGNAGEEKAPGWRGIAVEQAIAHVFPGLIGVGDGDGRTLVCDYFFHFG